MVEVDMMMVNIVVGVMMMGRGGWWNVQLLVMQIWALDPHHLPPPVIPGCRKYLLFTLARASDVASVLQPNIATFTIIAVQRKNKAA